ncbi:hypothetical protein GCM10010195_07470 [Kitasatospora griseola]|nr:hypothetical protein GCM10010195_07470 [Kitasatospora griseola]
MIHVTRRPRYRRVGRPAFTELDLAARVREDRLQLAGPDS